jgi:multisubunit Na+/H+ antiporter MnhB subunit
MKGRRPPGGDWMRRLAALLAAALGAVLLDAVLALPAPEIALSALVEARMEESGVRHSVTAVLLNFRGYDTLLEVAVLLLAALGVLALRPAAPTPVSSSRPDPGPILAALMRLVLPLAVLAAGYLLWAGARRPGGAFQAAAVLGGGGALLRLAGSIPPLGRPGPWLRMGLLLGLAVFLAIAAEPLGEGLNLLEYRGDRAGASILLVESALTVSIALILIVLFLGAAPPRVRRSPSADARLRASGPGNPPRDATAGRP